MQVGSERSRRGAGGESECGGRGVWCCKTAGVNAEQVRRMEKSNGGERREER